MVDAINYNITRNEIASRNKELSDIKNDTDELTFTESATYSAHGEAAKCVRDKLDQLKIKRLYMQTDEDYFNELLNDDLGVNDGC